LIGTRKASTWKFSAYASFMGRTPESYTVENLLSKPGPGYKFNLSSVSYSLDPGLSNGDWVSLKGHNLTIGGLATAFADSGFFKLEEVKDITVADAPPGVKYVVTPKVKGPAATPAKVRTPEESAARKVKEEARVDRNAWFSKRNLELKKGQLEEKLAKSVLSRASAIKKADTTVETQVDLDGWRVTTGKRGNKKRVKEVKRDGATRTTTSFTSTQV